MDQMKSPANQRHLAWHETLELHELVVFQSVGLMKIKQMFPKITNPTLKSIYQQAIVAMSNNIEELLMFYSIAPHPDREIEDRQDNLPFYAGDLLSLTKTSIRNYAIAITETATPQLRDVLRKQLIAAIDLHATVYNYMYHNNLYPSYDLNRLLKNDMNLATKALSAPY